MLKLLLCLKAVVMWPYPKNSSNNWQLYNQEKIVSEHVHPELADQTE